MLIDPLTGKGVALGATVTAGGNAFTPSSLAAIPFKLPPYVPIAVRQG